MLDGLLGRGAFYTKCKGLIKMTRTRIEAISRKRNATLRFLRKDIADLIACGLEDNAYGRVGGLVAELVLTSCYDFIGYVCEIILKQLAIMQKNSECPEDCREAVASLMYAAARFSDLPELRDLRNIFQERYGSALEFYVNQKLVENIAPKPPSTEKKIQLMLEIASEFSLKWDSRGFEQRMTYPSASKQDPPKTHVPRSAAERDAAPSAMEVAYKTEKLNGMDKEKNEVKYKNKGRDAAFDNEQHMHAGRDGVLLKENELIHRFHEREATSNGSKQPFREENFEKKKEHDISLRKQVDTNGSSTHRSSYGLKNTVESSHEAAGENRVHEVDRKEDHRVPFRRRELIIDSQDPPRYESTSKRTAKTSNSSSDRLDSVDGRIQHKADGNRKVVEPKVDVQSDSLQRRAENFQSKSDIGFPYAGRVTGGVAEIGQSGPNGAKPNFRSAMPPPYVKPRKANKPRDLIDLKPPETGVSKGDSYTSVDGNDMEQLNTRNNFRNRHGTTLENADTHGGYTNEYYKDDHVGDPTPRRRSSSRRRHSKSASSGDGNSNAEEDLEARVARRTSSSKRRGESRKSQQVLFDDDQCKRNDEEEKMIDNLLLHYCQKPPAADYTGARRHRTAESDNASMPQFDEAKNRIKVVPVLLHPPARSVSAPRQQPLLPEPKKVFSRVASFQPDMLSPAKHVHPKLPDYDDLAARFAALRRNKD